MLQNVRYWTSWFQLWVPQHGALFMTTKPTRLFLCASAKYWLDLNRRRYPQTLNVNFRVKKKEFLRERKRHTARCVASARSAALSPNGEGGTPPPVLMEGITSSPKRGTPIQSWWVPSSPPVSWMEYPLAGQMGYPCQSDGGNPLISWMVYPLISWMVYPHQLDRGTPSGQQGGTASSWQEVTPWNVNRHLWKQYLPSYFVRGR